MSDQIRVTAKSREPIDLEDLGRALLEIVDGLDGRSKQRLAEKGEKLLQAAKTEQAEADGKESAA